MSSRARLKKKSTKSTKSTKSGIFMAINKNKNTKS